jgi:AAA15 family ATPase/GTPase
MLLEYGLTNFLSFKEGVTVSFRLDANCPESVARGKSFTTVMCVKGANGSGKTQLLKGLAFVVYFAFHSFSRAPEEEVTVDSFYGNSSPSEFFVEFGLGASVYRYELVVSSKGVHRETLYRTIKKCVKLFERIGDSIEYSTKAFSGLKQMKFRSNASAISTAHQHEMKELEPINKFFRNIVSNVGYEGLRDQSFLDINQVSRMFSQRPEFLSFARDFIRECDIGIAEIEIIETEMPGEKKRYSPVFLHSVDGKNSPVSAPNESSGTKQLFRNLFAYKLVLSTGGVLVLDEFDIYLHPHILPKLIDLFMDPEKNKKNAQLLFTTHSLEIIDISGRYRTYLVNKDENVSFAFRLDEVPGDMLRNDRSLIPAYREGRIGGVPRL